MSYWIFRPTENELFIRNDAGDCRTTGIGILDAAFKSDDPSATIADAFQGGQSTSESIPDHLFPPIGTQEVWAAGVTYFRSRAARMEEAESVGGDIFYDRVYEAPRPELFFKSTPEKVRGHGAPVCIRPDSDWDVPEPELTLAISSSGKIFGFTVGNDMSSRSIEGENPLYLPQAKVYKGSCSLGPCLMIGETPSKETGISLTIRRNGEVKFTGETAVSQIKRSFGELAEFLFHSAEYPHGAYLMTGTGIVPDSDFTLQAGDEIDISIAGIGTLTNHVEIA